MVYEVKLPRLGWDMEEGRLADWLKKDGEYVQAGEMLFSVEGDKAVQEIEAFDNGFLKILPDGPKPGQTVRVGTLLGYLVPQEELASFKLPGSAIAAGTVPEQAPATGTPDTALEATQVAPQEALRTEGDQKRRIYISPYAKRLAQSLKVDWHTIKGSGLAGRIMARDVQEIAASGEQPETRLPITKIRKKIAEHMVYSAHTSAPVTLTTEVDATEMVALRKAFKNDAIARGQPIPSYTDILAKVAAQALLEHPMVNARIEGDEIVQSPTAHIAIAVDTDRGLIAPVLRDVQVKTVRQIARESALLIEKTRNGLISHANLQGATFTITNLGMFEIDAFTPIIDLPQCAILGVGRISPKQVVVDADNERVAIRQRMIVSLTFDHRLIDGARAARFLQRVKQFIETPYLWLE